MRRCGSAAGVRRLRGGRLVGRGATPVLQRPHGGDHAVAAAAHAGNVAWRAGMIAERVTHEFHALADGFGGNASLAEINDEIVDLIPRRLGGRRCRLVVFHPRCHLSG
jgi:ParB-like chromosome segregation protein Spo0J